MHAPNLLFVCVCVSREYVFELKGSRWVTRAQHQHKTGRSLHRGTTNGQLCCCVATLEYPRAFYLQRVGAARDMQRKYMHVSAGKEGLEPSSYALWCSGRLLCREVGATGLAQHRPHAAHESVQQCPARGLRDK